MKSWAPFNERTIKGRNPGGISNNKKEEKIRLSRKSVQYALKVLFRTWPPFPRSTFIGLFFVSFWNKWIVKYGFTVSFLLDSVSLRIFKRSPSRLKCWIEGNSVYVASRNPSIKNKLKRVACLIHNSNH